jgi:hypothetical protein
MKPDFDIRHIVVILGESTNLMNISHKSVADFFIFLYLEGWAKARKM